MNTIDTLRTKRDTRSYSEAPIEADLLDRLLDAARMAGSAKNAQPVRAIVITNTETQAALKASGDYASWIDQAAVVVVFTVPPSAGPRRLFDVGRHAQNLMVAAHAEGLASCPVTIHHEDIARQVLGIPEDVDPSMIVTLGWPAPSDAPNPVAGPRLPLDDYTHDERWS